MSEFSTTIELETLDDEQYEKSALPESLRKQFLNPDELNKAQEVIDMENEWLLAEREEMIEYIRVLKKLAVYLAGKTDIHPDDLSVGFFVKAERLFSEYIRREIETGTDE